MEGSETQQPNVNPGAGMVDMEKLSEIFDARMRDNLRVFAQEQTQATQQQRQQDQAAEQQRLAQEKAQQDAFGQVLNPYLGPIAQQLNFKADDTKDYVQFYTGNPDAVNRREQVEAKFNELAQAGRAIPREDINAWFVGREKMAKDREAAAQAALQASTLNAGAGQREAMLSKSPYDMSKDEMLSFLKGTSF